MKASGSRHVQLNLMLANTLPTMMPDGKKQELLLAIIDLLLEAISTDEEVEPTRNRRGEDAE